MKKRWMLLTAAAVLAMMTACTPTKTGPDGRPYKPGQAVESSDVETQPVETVEPMEVAFVFRVKDGVFQRVMLDVEELTEQTLVEKLIEYGVLDEGTQVLSFEIEGLEDAPSVDSSGPVGPVGPGAGKEVIGTLNLSKVPAWTADNERQMLICICNTFMDNFQLDEVKLLVNGENYSGAGITLGDEDYLEYGSNYKNVSE